MPAPGAPTRHRETPNREIAPKAGLTNGPKVDPGPNPAGAGDPKGEAIPRLDWLILKAAGAEAPEDWLDPKGEAIAKVGWLVPKATGDGDPMELCIPSVSRDAIDWEAAIKAVSGIGGDGAPNTTVADD